MFYLRMLSIGPASFQRGELRRLIRWLPCGNNEHGRVTRMRMSCPAASATPLPIFFETPAAR